MFKSYRKKNIELKKELKTMETCFNSAVRIADERLEKIKILTKSNELWEESHDIVVAKNQGYEDALTELRDGLENGEFAPKKIKKGS